MTRTLRDRSKWRPEVEFRPKEMDLTGREERVMSSPELSAARKSRRSFEERLLRGTEGVCETGVRV